MDVATTILWLLFALWLVMQVGGLLLNAWRLAFDRSAISDRMRERFGKLGPAGTAFEIVCSIGLLALVLGVTRPGGISRMHLLWMLPAYLTVGMGSIMKFAEWLGRDRQPVLKAAAVPVVATPSAAAPRPASPVPPPARIASPATKPARVQGWFICDADSMLVRDGMHRSEIGWSNRPERPLPPDCIRVDVLVAPQGSDPNHRVTAIQAYRLDEHQQPTDRQPALTARQRELVRQYIEAEIPPYMLKMGGQAVVDDFVGPRTAAAPRARKKHRPQDADERRIAFRCRACGRTDEAATVGGMVLRPVLGFWCRDCGSMLCKACQKTDVAQKAAAAGVAGTTVEHLGKRYPYEEWYGQECQSCATQFEMDMVNG